MEVQIGRLVFKRLFRERYSIKREINWSARFGENSLLRNRQKIMIIGVICDWERMFKEMIKNDTQYKAKR